MATSKQMKERSALINELVEDVRQHGIGVIKSMEYKYRTDVMASALAAEYITVADIPPNKAREVSEKLLKKQPDRIRDRAAKIGTDVHDLFERLALGEILEVPVHYANHVASWRQFMKDWQVSVVDTEFTVESVTHSYMGTGDLLFTSGNHSEMGLILGDYKSSESGIWPDIALQLAALRYADHILRCFARPHADDYEHTVSDVGIDKGVLTGINSCVGIQITAYGYRVVPVNVSENTFKVFLAAQIVADWKTEREKNALGESEFVPLRES